MKKQKVIITKGQEAGKEAYISGENSYGGVYLVDNEGNKIWNGQFASFDLSWVKKAPTIEEKEAALREINFFVGGLCEKGIEHYYLKMLREGKIK